MGTTLKVMGTTTSGDTFSDGLNAGKAQGKARLMRLAVLIITHATLVVIQTITVQDTR